MIATSPREHTATVGYDDSTVTVEQLKKALESVGYVMGEPKPVE